MRCDVTLGYKRETWIFMWLNVFAVKRGLNQLCKNPLMPFLFSYTQVCELKKVSSHAFLGLLLTPLINDIFPIFTGLTFRKKWSKNIHDFPVINCIVRNSFLFIHPNHEKWSCQKLICAKVSLISISGISIRFGSEVNMDQLSICRKKLILKAKPQKLKNRSFFENLSRHSMHPIIYRWMEREKTFLYFYKCDSPQSQWIKYESISEHLVHRHCQSFFTIAMGGQIQKLFIGDLRLKRFVIKFLAHSLVKVHMILHKKLKNSWRIAKWKCLFMTLQQ